MEKIKFSTSSVYDEEMKRFTQTRLYNRLQEKFRVKPYWESNFKLKLLSLTSSYILNVLSICTAFYFIYSLLVDSTGYIIASIFSVVLLDSLESFKRILAPQTIQRYFQFRKIAIFPLVAVIGLISCSALFSYKGSNLAFKSLSSKPNLVSLDSIKTAYNGKITALESKQNEMKKTR